MPPFLRAAAGIVLAAEQFAAEFEEQRRQWRDPAQLRAVVAVLPAEEGLVRQRAVEEIVGMRVVAVEVADVGRTGPGAG